MKSATIEHHRRLDRTVARASVATRAGYCTFLGRMAAAVVGLEALLERSAVAEVFADWPRRRRRDQLLADLGGLGMTGPDAPPATDRTRLTRSEVFGVMYVMEGSRLGAPFILADALGGGDTDIARNCRFLSPDSAAMLWRSFCCALEDERELRQDPSAAIAAAISAFETFERTLRARVPEGAPS